MGKVEERLSRYCVNGSSGRLRVFKAHITAFIYCNSGQLVHAEFYQLSGVEALREILDWGEVDCAWENQCSPQRKTLDHSFESAMHAVETSRQEKSASENEKKSDSSETLGRADGVILKGVSGASTVDPKKIRVRLNCITADHEALSVDLPLQDDEAIILGNSSLCDVEMLHESIAPEHCSFMLDNQQLLLWDLGSNGNIAVNGAIISESLIVQGDILMLGDMEFEVDYLLQRAGLKRGVSSAKSRGKRSTPTSGDIPKQPLKAEKTEKGERSASSLIASIFRKKPRK